MGYVCNQGIWVADVSDIDKLRVLKAAQWLTWHENTLYICRRGAFVEVPPIGERPRLLTSFQEALGYPGGTKLYEYVRCRYYWGGMQKDI